MTTNIQRWRDERARQRNGYWFSSMEWHRTPYWMWVRWLRGHTWRRLKYGKRQVLGWDYHTEAEHANYVLAQQFDRGETDAEQPYSDWAAREGRLA